jgi:hypothetical protein
MCPIDAWRILAGVCGRRRINKLKNCDKTSEWLQIAVQMDQLVDFGTVLATFAQATVIERDSRDLPVQMGK